MIDIPQRFGSRLLFPDYHWNGLVMVQHSIHGSLHARLARLRQRLIDQPDGPIWLWLIRIRVLEFVASRVSATPANRPAVQSDAATELPHQLFADVTDDFSEKTLSLEARTIHRWFVVGRPPRSMSALSPTLEGIEEIGEEIRARRGIRPAPGAVWEWWRDNWT